MVPVNDMVAVEAVSNPVFPVTFTLPKGWKLLKTEDNNQVLIPTGAATVDALILIHTGVYSQHEPLVAGLAQSLKDLGCQELMVAEEGEKSIQGKKAYVARGSARNAAGSPVEFGLYGQLSGKQLGAGFLVLTSAAQSAEAFRAAEALLASAQFGAFTGNALKAAALVGNWSGGSSEGSRTSGVGGITVASSTRYTFQKDGTFSFSHKSITSASGEFGELGSSLSKDSSTEDSGKYFVVGSKLVLAGQKQGTRVVGYTLQTGLLKIAGIVLQQK